MQQITIRDGIVELQEVTEVKRTRLPEFCDALMEQAGHRTPILPAGTVQYSTKGRASVYVVEAPPERRTVRFHVREDRAQEFQIPFPWIYILPVFQERALDRCYVYCTPKRIVTPDDTLFHLPVTNRYSDGLVCLGTYRFEITLGVPERVADVVRFFFESDFTSEILDSFNGYVPEEIATRTGSGENWFHGWARLTDAELPTVKWKPWKKLSEAVEHALEGK